MDLDRDFAVPRLMRLFSELRNVELAILFGSLAKGRAAHDVDVAVKFVGRTSLLDLGYVIARIAEELDVNEGLVDVVDLDRAHPSLLARVLREGIVIKDDGRLKELKERALLYPDALMELREWSTLDPNPEPDKVILASRVEEIRRNALFLRENILRRSVDELGYGEVLILERGLHRIIEAMLDVCRHLVSVYSLGLAESYGEYARKLVAEGKMPRDLGEDVARLAGLRNILVHRYIEVEASKLYSTARDVVDRIAVRFIEWVREIGA